MRNLSTIMKRAFLIAGLTIVTILVYTPAGAGESGPTFHISGSDAFSLSGGTGLRIPLTGSLSLDLNLSSVDTGQSPTGERQFGGPPIPLPRPPESDLHYTRFGVGFSFRF